MTKRLQVLFEDDELRELQRLARQHRMTTAEWVRRSLRAARDAESGADVSQKLSAVRAAAGHAFPTGDMVEVFLNVAPGTNSIEIESSLTGGESLHVIVEPADKSGRWLDETLTSSPSIADASFGFDVTASCAGY